MDNEFQEQAEKDLEEVSKLEKHVILVNNYFVVYFATDFVCFFTRLFFFLFLASKKNGIVKTF